MAEENNYGYTVIEKYATYGTEEEILNERKEIVEKISRYFSQKPIVKAADD